jgi:hypothetical protein
VESIEALSDSHRVHSGDDDHHGPPTPARLGGRRSKRRRRRRRGSSESRRGPRCEIRKLRHKWIGRVMPEDRVGRYRRRGECHGCSSHSALALPRESGHTKMGLAGCGSRLGGDEGGVEGVGTRVGKESAGTAHIGASRTHARGTRGRCQEEVRGDSSSVNTEAVGRGAGAGKHGGAGRRPAVGRGAGRTGACVRAARDACDHAWTCCGAGGRAHARGGVGVHVCARVCCDTGGGRAPALARAAGGAGVVPALAAPAPMTGQRMAEAMPVLDRGCARRACACTGAGRAWRGRGSSAGYAAGGRRLSRWRLGREGGRKETLA